MKIQSCAISHNLYYDYMILEKDRAEF